MDDPVKQPRFGNTIRSPKVASRRNEVRDRLLKTAARMFAEQGHSKVSVEELIETVGISRATFYGFFANKTELAANILLPVFDSGIKALNGKLPDDGLALAGRLIDLYLELWKTHNHALVLTSQLDSSLFPYIETPHQNFGKAMMNILQKIEAAGLLRNNDAALSYMVLAKTGIPLLLLYHEQTDFERIYRESMLALLIDTTNT
jgi:AcrR family transcriptional regulator